VTSLRTAGLKLCHSIAPRGISVSEEPNVNRRVMTVKELWRYPVKSLAGERLTEADLKEDGIPGDRIVHVAGPEGVRTARRYPRLLGLQGSLGPHGPLVNGHRWDTPAALSLVRGAAGDDAWLEAWDGPERFDILPLLVVTDGAIAAFGRDRRRLRPNIVIAGADGLEERNWEGERLQIGGALVRLESLRGRCVMISVDPDTLQSDPDVLKDVVRRFGGRLALDTSVARAGLVRAGDEAVFVAASALVSAAPPISAR
jgi:MOSC domain-containing protein